MNKINFRIISHPQLFYVTSMGRSCVGSASIKFVCLDRRIKCDSICIFCENLLYPSEPQLVYVSESNNELLSIWKSPKSMCRHNRNWFYCPHFGTPMQPAWVIKEVQIRNEKCSSSRRNGIPSMGIRLVQWLLHPISGLPKLLNSYRRLVQTWRDKIRCLIQNPKWKIPFTSLR